MIGSALVVVVVIYFITRFLKTREFKRKLSKLKCERSLPFLGHILKIGTDPCEQLNSLQRMWNNLGRDKFLLKLGPSDQVILTHPDDLEVILSSAELVEKNVLYDITKVWVGEGLLTSSGAKWRSHRKMLSPAFHIKVLKSYVEIYEDDAMAFVQNVLENQHQDVEITDSISSGTVNSMARSALGLNFDSEEDLATFKRSKINLEKIINGKVFSFWKRINVIYKLTNEHKEFEQHINNIHSIILKICNKKREELKDLMEAISSGKTTIEKLTAAGENEFTKKNLTFIEILLLSKKPNGQPLDAREIDDEINTFMVAGSETTSSTISFTLYALAQHPEIQENVYQEQLEITDGDLSKPITYADLQNMKYLDRVMKESLRMYPPSSYFGRLITKDTVLKDGTELPKGCSVLMFPYLTQRNPDIYKDPIKFDPDRFLDSTTNMYAYFPFSAGPRNCIGLKLANILVKSWLATIIRSCKVRPSNTKRMDLKLEIVLKPKNGIHLQFEKRKN